MSKIVRIPPSEIYGSQTSEIQNSSTGPAFVGYYKPNVPGLKAVTPSGKYPFKGRILPCYDFSMDTVDTAFKTGVAPYRVNDWADPNTGVAEFSEFMVSLPCYSYFGKSKNKFLSPTARYRWSRDHTAEDVADPVADIIKLIEGSGNPAWQSLTQRQGEDYATLPAASPRTFFNMWGLKSGERTPYNAIVDVSGGAMYDLKDQLNFRATPESPGIDPNWPQFLLGDVTDPQTGLIAVVSLISSVPQRKNFNGFIFQQNGGNRHTLENIAVRDVSPEVLAGRCLLLSAESVFKILTYQELVDFILDDGAVPQEVIKAACSYMANVTGKDNSKPTYVVPPPAQRAAPVTLAADFSFDDVEPFKGPAPVAPHSPATLAPSAPAAPPAAPPVEEPSFFHVTEGNNTPVEGTLSSIQEKINNGQKVQVYDGATWLKDASLLSLGLQIPAEAPIKKDVPPPPPSSSAVPAKYIPPPPPAEVGPPKPAEVIEFQNETLAESANLTAEDIAWHQEACIKLQKFQLNPEDMPRWVDLDVKIKATSQQ